MNFLQCRQFSVICKGSPYSLFKYIFNIYFSQNFQSRFFSEHSSKVASGFRFDQRPIHDPSYIYGGVFCENN